MVRLRIISHRPVNVLLKNLSFILKAVGIFSSFTSLSSMTFLSILSATHPHGSNLDLISTRNYIISKLFLGCKFMFTKVKRSEKKCGMG